MPLFSKQYRLCPDQYFPIRQPKDLIVLHHTVGGSAKSSFEAWQNDPRRIGTAYIVERDGTIYETFPADCWAFHIGVKGSRALDKRSIGIEIASEGPLTEQNGSFFAFGKPFHRDVYDHVEQWRGYRYFAAYTPPAMQAVCELVEHLLSLYSIPRQTPADHASSADYRDYKGVLAHSQLRADKSDVHPGFAWAQLIEHCKLATTVKVQASAA